MLCSVPLTCRRHHGSGYDALTFISGLNGGVTRQKSLLGDGRPERPGTSELAPAVLYGRTAAPIFVLPPMSHRSVPPRPTFSPPFTTSPPVKRVFTRGIE